MRSRNRVSQPWRWCSSSACNNREHIIGESVTAMMPDTSTAPGKGQRELAEQRARQPRYEGDRRIDRRERDGHGDDGEENLPRAEHGRVERLHALLDMAVDVLDHDDGVVHHEPDGEHEREQCHQIDRVAERGEQREHADERQRDGDDRDDR